MWKITLIQQSFVYNHNLTSTVKQGRQRYTYCFDLNIQRNISTDRLFSHLISQIFTLISPRNPFIITVNIVNKYSRIYAKYLSFIHMYRKKENL